MVSSTSKLADSSVKRRDMNDFPNRWFVGRPSRDKTAWGVTAQLNGWFPFTLECQVRSRGVRIHGTETRAAHARPATVAFVPRPRHTTP